MGDEYDDLEEPAAWRRPDGERAGRAGRREVPAARLVSRLFHVARPPLRARLLACLLQPLGPLAVAGVAAGAFGRFAFSGGAERTRAAMDDMLRVSSDQVLELAHFVEQVSPEALQEFARLLAENPVGMAAFSTSAVLLLMRKLRTSPGP